MQNLWKIPNRENSCQSGPCEPDKIIIVFVDETECTCLRWLKRGFRHCFAAIQHQDYWIICDSLKTKIEISMIRIPMDFNICKFYSERGHTVLIGRKDTDNYKKQIYPEFLTCVSVAKRIIGIQCYFILTPWQLFKKLTESDSHWRHFS